MIKHKIILIFTEPAIFVLTLIILHVVGVNTLISTNLAEIFFSTLIQINGILIGFFGIILVYNLRIYMDNRNMLFTHAFQTAEKLQTIEFQIQENNEKKSVELLKMKKKSIKENFDKLEKDVNFHNLEHVRLSNFSVIPILCYLISIIFSLIAITKISEGGLNTNWMMIPLLAFFSGVLWMMISMIKVKKENKKNN